MIQFIGKKVLLRETRDTDIASIIPWLGTNASYSLDVLPGMKDDIIQVIQRAHGDQHAFVIENTSHILIGYIFTYFCDRKNGSFSYYIFINSSYRCQGFAKESIEILLRFYFQELRFQKVTISIFAFNKSAATLHDTIGFKMEGRIRRMLYSHGQFFDLLTYGITNEEFDNISIEAPFYSERVICEN